MTITIKMDERDLKNVIAAQMKCRPDDILFGINDCVNGGKEIDAVITTVLKEKDNDTERAE